MFSASERCWLRRTSCRRVQVQINRGLWRDGLSFPNLSPSLIPPSNCDVVDWPALCGGRSESERDAPLQDGPDVGDIGEEIHRVRFCQWIAAWVSEPKRQEGSMVLEIFRGPEGAREVNMQIVSFPHLGLCWPYEVSAHNRWLRFFLFPTHQGSNARPWNTPLTTKPQRSQSAKPGGYGFRFEPRGPPFCRVRARPPSFAAS